MCIRDSSSSTPNNSLTVSQRSCSPPSLSWLKIIQLHLYMKDNEIHGVPLHQITGFDSLESNVIIQDEYDFLLQTLKCDLYSHVLCCPISETTCGKINLPIKLEVKQAEHTNTNDSKYFLSKCANYESETSLGRKQNRTLFQQPDKCFHIYCENQLSFIQLCMWFVLAN